MFSEKTANRSFVSGSGTAKLKVVVAGQNHEIGEPKSPLLEPDPERARNGHLARVSCASVLTAIRGRSAPSCLARFRMTLVNTRHLTIPDTFWVRL
jgi:hypothetical protein